MTLLLLVAACADPAHVADGAGDMPALDVACTEEAGAFGALSAETTEVPTVLRATFSTLLEGRRSVVFADSKVRLEAPVVGDAALLVGVGPGERVAWRAVVETAVGAVCSPVQGSETGLLPADVPEILVGGESDGGGGYVLTPIIAQDSVTATMIDPFGRVVWAHRMMDQAHLGPYRVRPSPDGLGIVAAASAPALDAVAEVMRVDWAGGERGQRSFLRGGHTDMTQLPDGTVAMLGWEIREVSPGRRMLGDTIIEVGPDGSERRVWGVFDSLTPRTDEFYTNTFYTADLSAEDWTHGSGLSYDAQNDDYLMTLRGLSLVVRVDRAGGHMAWAAGGGRLIVPSGSTIEGPHSVQRLYEDTYLVFNNGTPGQGGCSRAATVRIDPETHAVEARQVFEPDPCLEVIFLGDARAQADDSVRVAWSSEGRLETFTSEGESRQTLDLPVGHAFGFVEPVSLTRR